MKNIFTPFFYITIVITGLLANIRSCAQITTFGFTGGMQTWTVPVGVSTISVTVNGAPGGSVPFGGAGGCGSRVMCNLSVTTGQVINIFVGGAGGNATSTVPGVGGFNGGGAGAISSLSPASAGGGGSSDLRIGGTTTGFRVVSAGAGGGGGAHCGTETGGDGGGSGVAGSGLDCSAVNLSTCGQGASPSTPGMGASSGGFPGSTLTGGAGFSPSSAGAGGGGGGGYWGGGGGNLGGGGGGSSFVNGTLGSSATYGTGSSSGNCSGDGSVVISTACTPPIVAPITGPSIVCPGNTITLNDITTGGTWLSSNSGIASASSGGVVTGNTVGNVLIWYIVSNACGIDTASAWVMVGNPIITTIAGRGPSVGDGGPATASLMQWPTMMITDASNNILVTDYNAQRVRQITPGGIITTIIGTGSVGSTGDGAAATLAKVSGPAGLCKDYLGNIYVTEQNGCRVRKVDPSGIISTIAGTGFCGSSGDGLPATAAGLGAPTGVAVDRAGNVYISEWSGGHIRMVNTSGIISTMAGGGVTTGTGGPATAAMLTSPYALWLDGSQLYVTEENAYRVRVVDLSTGIINAFAGTGAPGYTGDGGPATAATFSHLASVYATDNNIYISDGDNEVTRVVSKGTGIITTFAGNHALGFGGDGGDPLMATCYKNTATVIDGNGTIYIAESGNHCIRKIAPVSVASVTPIAGTPFLCQNVPVLFHNATAAGVWTSSNTAIAIVASASGQVTGVAAGAAVITYSLPYHCGNYIATFAVTVNSFSAGTISGPTNVCPTNTITLTDATGGGIWSSSNNAIATVSGGVVTGVAAGNVAISYTIANGCGSTSAIQEVAVGVPTVTTIIGTGVGSFFGDGGPASAAHLYFPTSAVMDATGNIYISDNINARIRKVNTAGIISTIAGTGTGGFNGDGVAATAQINSPYQIAVDGSGNVYFADEMNYRVRKINISSGTITTVAGNGTAGSAGDGGAATAAQINRPRGVAFDGTGNLYISDWVGNRIRKVTPGGTITTFAGTGSATYNGDGIMASVAAVVDPEYIKFDALGNMYISDIGDVRIRKINTLGVISTVAGDYFTGGGGDGGPATAASMDQAGGIAVDKAGNVYIPDMGGNRLRIVNSLGVINAYAGIGGVGGFLDGSPITSAKFNAPTDLFWDQNDNLLVVDHASHSIRKIGPMPTTVASVSGSSNLCVGDPALFTDATPGGVWTSSVPGVATVGSTGLVFGLTAGVTVISYGVTFQCGVVYATKSVTISPVPATPGPILGPNQVCLGTTISLSDGVPGGPWTSGSFSIATVGSTGIVTGVSLGATLISYTIGNACSSATVTTTVTVTSGTGSLSGASQVCQGTLTSVGASPSGGIWTSGNNLIATIGSTSGLVSGISAGNVTFTYTFNGNCTMPFSLTVNPLPPLISGTLNVCAGSNTNLSSGSGGTWSSSNIPVAIVGSTTGIVSGISSGTAGITYTSNAGCQANTIVTVFPTPANITPPAPVTICAGSNSVLADVTPGGTWSSGAGTIATVAGGTVTGITAGVATISYTNSQGCSATKAVTVALSPAPISPAGAAVCVGNNTTLTETVGGGSWSASNGNATVIGGIVTGVAGGGDVISYSIGACVAFANVTVNSTPFAINPSGPVSVCTGASTGLSDPTPGGTWSSATSGIASVSSGGSVNGLTAGIATISYSNSSGCAAIKLVTVNQTPSAISPVGPMVCTGNTLTLTDIPGGGTWTSGNVVVAPVGGATGIVTGASVGTAPITYTLANCIATTNVTVNPSPSAGSISGPAVGCTGTTFILTDGAGGGTWSSSNPGIASVGPTTGVVTGVAVGAVTITYSVNNSCGVARATYNVTINASPAAAPIIGVSMLCAGTYSMLTDAVSGGAWSASNSHASITGTGLLTGISIGTDTISYRVTNSCGTAAATKVVTIGPFLSAGIISGASTVCTGSSITLTDPVAGGAWNRSNGSASVNPTGHVTGVIAGIDTISYTITSGCGSAVATKAVTVITTPAPGIITGPASICAGAVINYTTTATGGTWSMSNSHASITSAGVLTGLTAGTDTIKYTVANSCGTAVTTKIVTIGAAVSPGSISGPSAVCPGASITLTDGVLGGRWTSSTASATIGSTGIVTGVSAGVTTISYTIVASCGMISATKAITVNPMPSAGTITGADALCIGTPGIYTTTGTGGTWTVTNSHATISAIGVVSPVSAGRDTIRYTVTTSCGTAVATLPITIGTAVSVAPIAGSGTVCIGATITLVDPSTGGVWSASNTAATVGSTGIVTGVRTGVDTIRYTITGSCNSAAATATVSVGVAPVAGTIFGPAAICTGATATYTDAASGGVWSFTNTHASVSATGIVTPLSAGTDTLRYTVTGSCGAASATLVITIGTSSAAGPIAGPVSVCTGTTITLTDGTPGGAWSSSNANASIGSTGIVTGITPGTDVITYTISGSCGTSSASFTITINASPVTAPIVGPSVVCAGSFTIYTDAAPGGSWSVSNIHATIASTGVLTATSIGIDTVMYSVMNSCGSSVMTKAVTISTSMTAGTITGPTSVCIGSPAALSDAISGGTWSSSNSNASISSAGVVTGLHTGVVTMSYTVSGSCGTAVATYVVTIGSSTGAGIISGSPSVCVGSLTTLTESVSGGAWSSSNTNATITTAGIVTGIVPALDTISYTVTSACGIAATTKVITISPAPVAGSISGPTRVCAGTTITLTDPVPGGSWSSNNSNATVSGTGVATGVSAGTDVITYTVSGSCGSSIATYPITIDPLAAVAGITGFDSVCIGSSLTLADATPGGSWSSGNANATVSAAGVVTGMLAGTSPISYTVSGSCGPVSAVLVVTILPSASSVAITGPSSVCVGSGITLTASVPGGSWVASNSTAMIVGPGIVDGMFVGVDTVYYSISGMCGSSTAMQVVSVNPVPLVPAITGPVSQPVGTSVPLSDALPGGIWTSSNPAVASVVPGSGLVNGISTGSTVITYTVTNSFGCPGSVTVSHFVGGTGMPVTKGKDGDVKQHTDLAADAQTVAQHSTTGINVVAGGIGELKVFPNPNNGTFSFTLVSAADGPVQLIISDAAGRVVATIPSVTNKQTEVKLNEASGMYLLKASDGVSNYMQKIIIQ